MPPPNSEENDSPLRFIRQANVWSLSRVIVEPKEGGIWENLLDCNQGPKYTIKQAAICDGQSNIVLK